MTQRLAALRAFSGRRATQRALVVVLALALLTALAWRHVNDAQAGRKYTVPQSASLENKTGVRVSRAAVVAAGGIVEIRYTVLDAQKASRFQSDVKHPPLLKSEKRNKGTAWRTALMRQGHTLRPGQSYYILYLNNHNAIHSGDTIEIDAGGSKLQHVPVR